MRILKYLYPHLFLIGNIILSVPLISSCVQEQNKKELLLNKNTENFLPTFKINEDSLLIDTLDKNSIRVIKAGVPDVIKIDAHVFSVAESKIIVTNPPRVCTPGQDGFLLPKKVLAIPKPSKAGRPELVLAKDPYMRDQNPQNFNSFGKLQGLKNNVVKCVIQDKIGNLWLGTYGGVSKYDGKYFSHFTTKEGLAQNNILAILEDSQGNLWFGTEGRGISKYDGFFFTNFTKEEGLSGNIVRAIVEDQKGNFWFGTDEGLSKFDGKTFTHFTEKEGLSHNIVRTIVEDKKGNLWIGTDRGISIYDGKNFTHFTKDEGLSDNKVYSIIEDKKGNFWFGTERGLTKYNGAFFSHFKEIGDLSETSVYSILEDNKQNLWFGTYGGIGKYDGKVFTHFTETEGIANNDIATILEDRSGNLWFGTNGGGLSRYFGGVFTHFSEKEGLSHNYIRAILRDKSGNLWFGSYGGISKYDGKTLTNFTSKAGIISSSVFSILEDRSGNIWFGSWGESICKYDGKTFSYINNKQGMVNDVISSILEDYNGNFWFGTNKGVSKYDGKTFTHFTSKNGLANATVRSILEDKNKNLWFGTEGGGVSYFNQDKKTFTHFTTKEGLANNIVRTILEDKNGNLWFGTNGGGITVLSKQIKDDFRHSTSLKKQEIITLSEKEGLPSNNVYSMIFDKVGNLVIGTAFGLSIIDAKNLKNLEVLKQKAFNAPTSLFKNYAYEDGFLGIGVNGGKSICEAKDGSIWIGANDRLTTYYPQSYRLDSIPPNVQLTNIELFNESIDWANLITYKTIKNNQNQLLVVAKDTSFVLGNGVVFKNFNLEGISSWYELPKNLNLAYNNNYLTFNFIGITQGQAKRVKYQYKLEGIDKNWSALNSRTSAPYGNLPQGYYAFKVKAINSAGYWSKEYIYNFTIRPPWWETWWFRLLLIIVFLVSGPSFYFFRMNAAKKQNQKLENLVSVRTRELNEKNEEILKQNDELNQQQEEIATLNNHLEVLVEERTQKLIQSNKKLNEYAFFNAHKLRAPIATILGLYELIKAEPCLVDKEVVFAKIKESIILLDEMVRISQSLLDEVGEIGIEEE